ncbi:MAG: ATP-dependent RecD-like DNA helicase [Clostridiales bacterium]|nr:ATP-dependent RecD-like DNA helicase [Clostridiales bacterium]
MEEKELENLTGTVDNITYKNESTGYAVIEIATDSDLVTVVGTLGNIVIGEEIVVQGEWVIHPSYGRQFKAMRLQHTMPADAAGMLRFLSGGIIKGVREATASKIVELFGSETFNVIENEPERLAEIKGINKRKAIQIGRDFKMQFAARDIMNGLADLGLSQQEAFSAYNLYKSNALDIINENPYAFVSENGFTFERADEIAQNLQNKPSFDYRSQAGVTYVVRYNLHNGHTCLPRNSIIKPAMNLLECSEDDVEIAIDNALEAKQLIQEEINGKNFLFLPEIYRAESSIAERIQVMLNFPPTEKSISQSEIFAFEDANDIIFDEKQRLAIEIAVNKGMLILTGGPGTGKTTTVKGIITLMKNRGLDVALTAPTGRAAKRMSELTGFEAKTIHRLLEVEYREGASEPCFTHNLRNPLECDAVIVDELSMVDVTLFAALLDALPLSCRLIMVGDKDQLPPVGAGNVLADLIQSGLIGVVSLDKIFRQAMESQIVSNAHRVVAGKMPIFDNSNPKSDFFLLNEESRYSAPKKVVNFVTKRIPAGYGFDAVNEIQVLCPGKKGEVGTENINAMLQEALNPPSAEKAELKYMGYTLREGDKVMQIKNNYDVPWFKDNENGTGVFNGDIGILTRIDKASDIINVRFDDREAMYSIESAKEIGLAYAMTVHKSQGSEFDAVVLPIVNTPQKLAYRNLFYTALTRAKKLLVIVGNEAMLKSIVDNDKKSRRYSALVHFLSVDNSGFLK